MLTLPNYKIGSQIYESLNSLVYGYLYSERSSFRIFDT